jgi:hypothetical protein
MGDIITTRARKDTTATWWRWIARGVGSLVAGFWLLIGGLYAVVGSDPWTWESAVMAVLIVSSALSVLIAWWREGLGGMLVGACGIAHAVFAIISAGRNRAFAVLISGGPFLLTGILFLASWRAQQRPALDGGDASA